MQNQSQLCDMIAALLFLCFLTTSSVVEAREDTLSYFQYATPIELPLLNAPQLIELKLSAQIYNSVRPDFADLRIVQSSNHGLVPVKIAPNVMYPGGGAVLLNRSFSILEDGAADLKGSYPGSRIITVQTERVPITQFVVRVDPGCACRYMLLGRSAANPTGAEWRLLARSEISPNSQDHVRREHLTLDFSESLYSVYAIVVDGNLPVTSFTVESAAGPEYCAYFQALPSQSYTLLTGYPEAPPISGLNTDTLAFLLEKGEIAVAASASPLIDNPGWRERGIRARMKNKMFLLPVAIAAALMLLLLLFVIVYSFANRKKPLKLQPRPRFQRLK